MAALAIAAIARDRWPLAIASHSPPEPIPSGLLHGELNKLVLPLLQQVRRLVEDSSPLYASRILPTLECLLSRFYSLQAVLCRY